MASKMKNHKACGKEVTPSAKVCPSCGRNLKLGFGKKSLLGIGSLVLLRIIKSASTGGRNSTLKTAKPSPSSISSAPIGTSLASVIPTKKFTTANVNIKVLEVIAPDYTNQDLVKAYPHGSWVVVKLSIQNNHEDAICVTSSNVEFLDRDKRKFTILMGETVGLEMTGKVTSFLTVKPGNTIEGYLAYDVPKGLTGFTMEGSECVTGTPTKIIRQ